MIRVQVYFGDTIVTIEGATRKECIQEASFWQEIPSKCPVPGCGASIIFTYRTPQSFTYWGVRCLGPEPHESTFGQLKEGAELFYKNGEAWKKYIVGQGRRDEEAASASAPAEDSPRRKQELYVVDLVKRAGYELVKSLSTVKAKSIRDLEQKTLDAWQEKLEPIVKKKEEEAAIAKKATGGTITDDDVPF